MWAKIINGCLTVGLKGGPKNWHAGAIAPVWFEKPLRQYLKKLILLFNVFTSSYTAPLKRKSWVRCWLAYLVNGSDSPWLSWGIDFIYSAISSIGTRRSSINLCVQSIGRVGRTQMIKLGHSPVGLTLNCPLISRITWISQSLTICSVAL